MGRERFSSRLGFILISAGCAIGLGNVWRFPYIVGQYGGAAFVLIYAAFLVLLGLPIIVMEYSVGRASQKSAALSFDVLEPKGTKWHFEKWFAMAGNYVLMMFYTTVAGWLLLYVFKMAKGDFVGLDADGVAGDDLCCSSLFWYLCPGSGCRCRAYYKSNDGLPVIPDGCAGNQFGADGRRTSGT